MNGYVYFTAVNRNRLIKNVVRVEYDLIAVIAVIFKNSLSHLVFKTLARDREDGDVLLSLLRQRGAQIRGAKHAADRLPDQVCPVCAQAELPGQAQLLSAANIIPAEADQLKQMIISPLAVQIHEPGGGVVMI